MKSNNINEHKPNGSPIRPSREFQERMRQVCVELMNRLHE